MPRPEHALGLGGCARSLRLLALAGAALVAGAGAAGAQAVVVVPGGPAFTPAQRAYVEAYVIRHPVPPAPIPRGYVARVGGYVPAGVPLRSFDTYNDAGAGEDGPYGTLAEAADDDGYAVAGPDGYEPDGYEPGGYGQGGYGQGAYEPGGYNLAGYRYVVMPGNTAAVVEPASRRIILIIE